MTRESFNVNGLGEILKVAFERGSLVSKLIILIVSVPEFCEDFSSANNEDETNVKRNDKAIIEIIKAKNSFNIVSFTSKRYRDLVFKIFLKKGIFIIITLWLCRNHNHKNQLHSSSNIICYTSKYQLPVLNSYQSRCNMFPNNPL